MPPQDANPTPSFGGFGLMPDNVVDIIQTQNELRDHGHWFTLWPERWSTYSDVHEWNLSRLADSELHNIPLILGFIRYSYFQGVSSKSV